MTTSDTIGEFKRKKRVADILTTAHNILGERYRKISVVFDITVMLVSFLILVASLVELAAPARIASILGFWTVYAIPVGAIVIFILSVVEWRISWKQKAEAHFSAANVFSLLRGEITALLSRGFEDGDVDAAKIEDRYDKLGQACVKIPHAKFVRLKRAHMRKVALSKLLDKQPFANSMVLRIRLAMRHTSDGWSAVE